MYICIFFFVKSQGIQVLSHCKIYVNTSKRDICNISCTYKLQINNPIKFNIEVSKLFCIKNEKLRTFRTTNAFVD